MNLFQIIVHLPVKKFSQLNYSDDKINDEDYKTSINLLNEISKESDEYTELGWLLDTTEKFCQDKVYITSPSLSQSVSWIIQMVKRIKELFLKFLVIPLSVSFDPHVGHDYIDDSDDRFDFYHRVEERIPFDLEYFNKITKVVFPKRL